MKDAYAIVRTNEDEEGNITKLVYQVRDSVTDEPLDIPQAICGVTDEERVATMTGLAALATEQGYELNDIRLAEEVEVE